jgi:hypothetical protein
LDFVLIHGPKKIMRVEAARKIYAARRGNRRQDAVKTLG